MSTSGSLKDFLREKKERDEASGRLTAKEERIQRRLDLIDVLFADIEKWLRSSIEERVVGVAKEPYTVLDKHLGALEERSLKLSVGASEVVFAPVTSSIAGASARVDMTCGDRTLPIVFLVDRGWHFLVRGLVTRTEPVTEESFGEALREILEG
jgi:hypothetical protein